MARQGQGGGLIDSMKFVDEIRISYVDNVGQVPK